MQDNNALWRAFVATPGFKRSLDTRFWYSPIDEQLRAMLLSADWIDARRLLKNALVPDEYQRLLARFRQFKRRQKRAKIVVELDKDIAERLQDIQRMLGMTTHQEGINDVLDYLLMAEPEQVWNLNRNIKTDLSQERSKPLLQRLIRMHRSLHYLHSSTVEEALVEAFNEGARAGTNASPYNSSTVIMAWAADANIEDS